MDVFQFTRSSASLLERVLEHFLVAIRCIYLSPVAHTPSPPSLVTSSCSSSLLLSSFFPLFSSSMSSYLFLTSSRWSNLSSGFFVSGALVSNTPLCWKLSVDRCFTHEIERVTKCLRYVSKQLQGTGQAENHAVHLRMQECSRDMQFL